MYFAFHYYHHELFDGLIYYLFWYNLCMRICIYTHLCIYPNMGFDNSLLSTADIIMFSFVCFFLNGIFQVRSIILNGLVGEWTYLFLVPVYFSLSMQTDTHTHMHRFSIIHSPPNHTCLWHDSLILDILVDAMMN